MISAITLADAVVTALNALTGLAQTFTATRKVLPFFELKEMTALMVTVVPRTDDTERYTRSDILHTFGIDVAIQKKIAGDEDIDAQTKTLADLVNAMVDAMRGLPVHADVKYTGSKVDPVYSPEHLAEFRVFTSVIKLEYKGLT